MIIYKATKEKGTIDEEPKNGQTIIIETIVFITIVALGAVLGATVSVIFALIITFISGNGFDGFSLFLNNNLTCFTAFGAVLFALMLIIE